MVTRKSTTVSSPRLSAIDKKYQAQEDLRTMQRAAEIQGNKVRMIAAQREAQNQMKALSSVAKKK